MKKTLVFALTVLSLTLSIAVYADDTDYYNQFVYKKECMDDGDGDTTCQYRNLMANETITISPLHQINVSIGLFLNEDMTATIRYNEMHMVRTTPTAEWRTEIRRFCQIEKNAIWAAPSGFVFGDALVGKRATWNSQNAVEVTFMQSLDSEEIKGRSMVLSYGYSNVPKDPAMPPACR